MTLQSQHDSTNWLVSEYQFSVLGRLLESASVIVSKALLHRSHVVCDIVGIWVGRGREVDQKQVEEATVLDIYVLSARQPQTNDQYVIGKQITFMATCSCRVARHVSSNG